MLKRPKMAYWYGCGAKTFHLPGLRRTLTCQVRLVFEEFDQKLGLGSGACGGRESEVSHFLVPNGSKWHSEGSRAKKCLNYLEQMFELVARHQD